jgi:hypothetical protein
LVSLVVCAQAVTHSPVESASKFSLHAQISLLFASLFELVPHLVPCLVSTVVSAQAVLHTLEEFSSKPDLHTQTPLTLCELASLSEHYVSHLPVESAS